MPLNDQDININFCSILGLYFSKNNDQHSALSMFIGEFNVKCAKCWATDKNNAVGLELNNITKTGYSQMNHKQTHFINELPSFIDLIFYFKYQFCKKLWLFSEFQCMWSFNVPFTGMFGIANANTEIIWKTISMSIKMQMKNAKHWLKIYWTFSKMLFPTKPWTFDSRTPDWMN